jgi:hypothetical protein
MRPTISQCIAGVESIAATRIPIVLLAMVTATGMRIALGFLFVAITIV